MGYAVVRSVPLRPAPRGVRGFGCSVPYGQRAKRLGQSGLSEWFTDPGQALSDLGTDIEDIIPGMAPTAGGGSVTTTQPVQVPDGQGGYTTVPAGTSYVNSQGDDQGTPDKCAGQTGINAALCGAGIPPLTIPSWVYWGIGGLVGLTVINVTPLPNIVKSLAALGILGGVGYVIYSEAGSSSTAGQ